MTDDLVTVSTHPTMVEAEMAKGILEAAGIEAYIHAPHANALYPGVLGEVMLQVREEDLKKAEQALEQGEVVEE
ncbi:MAG: DUF2007 domain-containing protein [Pseudomonadota bacterium]